MTKEMEVGKLEGHNFVQRQKSSGDPQAGAWGIAGRFTIHILLTLVYHERVSSMLLLFLSWFFVLVSINYNPDL